MDCSYHEPQLISSYLISPDLI